MQAGHFGWGGVDGGKGIQYRACREETEGMGHCIWTEGGDAGMYG